MNIKAKHLEPQCTVFIKKPKLKVLDKYRDLVTYILNNDFTVEGWLNYLSALKKIERKRLLDAINNKKILFDPGDNIDPEYYYTVVDDFDYVAKNIRETSLKTIPQIKNLGAIKGFLRNKRVLSVNVNQKNSNVWAANITLDNTDDIFYLSTHTYTNDIIFQEKDCVIESNDEVVIYLTDWKGMFKPVFRGFVDEVKDADDGLNKRIQLSCTDMTKLLAISRSNANPSLNPAESEGNTLTIFQNAWADKTPGQIINNILARTYCNILGNPIVISELKKDIDDLRSSKSKDVRADAFKIIQNTIDKYTESDLFVEKIPDLDKTTVSYEGYKNGFVLDSSGNLVISKKELAYKIYGLSQPVWAEQINTGTYDYLISNWMPNNQLINEIATNTFFEFFADANGVIHFRPYNFTLPITADEKKETGDKTEKEETYNDMLKYNYWLTLDKEVYIKSFEKSINDRKLFTDIVISGAYGIQGITNSLMRKLVTGPYKYRRQYGVKMMPQETKIDIIGNPALEMYGQARLWRQNSEYTEANIVLQGNSALTAGNPIYIERWQSVYYITNVTHNFTAGGEYTTILNLNYKRKPLCLQNPSYLVHYNSLFSNNTVDITKPIDLSSKLSLSANSSNFLPLRNVLTNLVNLGEISEVEKSYVLKNEASLTWGMMKVENINKPGNYVTGNIVWEAMMPDLYPPDMQLYAKQLGEFAHALAEENVKLLNKIGRYKKNAKEMEEAVKEYNKNTAKLKTILHVAATKGYSEYAWYRKTKTLIGSKGETRGF